MQVNPVFVPLGFDFRVSSADGEKGPSRVLTVDSNVWRRPQTSLGATDQIEILRQRAEAPLGLFPQLTKLLDILSPDLDVLAESSEGFAVILIKREQILLSDAALAPQRASAYNENEFELLAFDVADSFLLSGLYNCGLDDEDLGLSSGQGIPHRLVDVDNAVFAKHRCNTLVPEHAPFYVYSLHAVPEQYWRSVWARL